ncbi:hypothetical protein C7402_111297 [Paraburkholderia unamae]|uniref:Uncharacterized protein n=1 Tax=Paraburkholderia unamae TaxID=219649 RepID=A0ABX5KPG3_9BURK|nr:hypothetical protein C7402_111297 [Paraburkholderia unamae]RAR54645.1 hypothetical protein C7401_124142 [Paraburkholderia unamae]
MTSAFVVASGTVSPILHVFEQEGGWHWGITLPRSGRGGFRIVAYSDRTFANETEARDDGSAVLVRGEFR